MSAKTEGFEEVVVPVRDALFETGLSAEPEAAILFSDPDNDGGRFDVVFETVRPGLFLRAEGYLPTAFDPPSGGRWGRCALTLGTSEDGDTFEDWQPVRRVRVSESLDLRGAPRNKGYSISTESLTEGSVDDVVLVRVLLDIAVAVLPYFEDLSARA